MLLKVLIEKRMILKNWVNKTLLFFLNNLWKYLQLYLCLCIICKHQKLFINMPYKTNRAQLLVRHVALACSVEIEK